MAINPIYKVKTNSKIEFNKHIVSIYCSLKGLKISERETLILSWFMSEGYNKITKEKLIENNIVKNDNNMSGIIHKLRGLGFIVHKEFKEALCNDLTFEDTNLAMINIILDNR